ncbi:hypothetical protein E2320_001268, partial [Naja naja]
NVFSLDLGPPTALLGPSDATRYDHDLCSPPPEVQHLHPKQGPLFAAGQLLFHSYSPSREPGAVYLSKLGRTDKTAMRGMMGGRRRGPSYGMETHLCGGNSSGQSLPTDAVCCPRSRNGLEEDGGGGLLFSLFYQHSQSVDGSNSSFCFCFFFPPLLIYFYTVRLPFSLWFIHRGSLFPASCPQLIKSEGI